MLDIVNIGHPENLAWLTASRVCEVGIVVDREVGRPYGRLDAMAGGVATVAKGRIRAHGECSCGWRGSEHVLSAVAVHDTLIHAAAERCQPGVPLVW
jgi:hypothetical protein